MYSPKLTEERPWIVGRPIAEHSRSMEGTQPASNSEVPTPPVAVGCRQISSNRESEDVHRPPVERLGLNAHRFAARDPGEVDATEAGKAVVERKSCVDLP